MMGSVDSAAWWRQPRIKTIYFMYSLFTLRKPCSSLILNGERGFLGVNRQYDTDSGIRQFHAKSRRSNAPWGTVPTTKYYCTEI